MRTDGFNVFIVEDDASIRDALSLLLGLRGFSVSIFADAESFQRGFLRHLESVVAYFVYYVRE